MDKTLTLQPICITDGSSFGKILKSSDRKDYRTINGGTSLNVGVVGFEYDSLHARSTACKFNKLHVNFSQSGGDLGWTNWELTPYEVSNFEIKEGTRLTRHTDRIIGFTKKTGSHDLDKWYSQSYDFDNGNAPLNLFGSNMLALGLVASNDAIVSQKLWMKELTLTLTYTARYYAQFYNEGTIVKTQTVDGGKSARAPSVSKTGYRLVGWKRGNTTYSANELPTSEYTDLRFDAVWERIYYKVTLPKTKTGSCRVTNADGSFTYAKSKDTDTTEKVTVAHGDLIKVYASGFGTRSQNLLVKINNGAETEVTSQSADQEIQVCFGTVTEELAFQFNTKIITFQIQVASNSGGNVNVPASVVRYNNVTITAQAYTGYKISWVEIDGVRTNLSGETESWAYTIQSVVEQHSVEVHFEIKQRTVAFQGTGLTVYDITGNTAIDVTAGAVVDYGSSHDFSIQSSGGYIFRITYAGNALGDYFKAESIRDISIDNITDDLVVQVDTTTEVVNVSIEQNEGGTITGEPGSYFPGMGSLEFRAVAQQNYVLRNWFNGDTEYTTTLAITSDLTNVVVFAEFEQPEYEVYCTATGIQPGHLDPWTEVIPDAEGKSHGYYVNSGESVSVPYYLNEGGIVSQIKVNVDGVLRYITPRNPEITILGCTITLTDHSVEVVNVQSFVDLVFYFMFGTFSCSFTAVPEGIGNFQLTRAVDGSVIEGDEITLIYHEKFFAEAIPAEGWHLAYWSDDKNNAANPRVFEMPGHNGVIEAVFEKDQKKITIEAGEGGAATPSRIVEYGDDFLIEIETGFGQKIKDVFLDGLSIYDDVTLTRRGGRYLLRDITEHHTIKVAFTAKTYTNGRRLFDYWPPVIQRIHDMQEIARVQQPFIDEAWDAVSWLMENQFIDSATEEAVILWEKELGIVPNASDTLRQRKERLRIKWVPHNRFSISWLHEWLCSATGRNDIQWPYVPENTYGLLVHLPVETNWQAIFRDLDLYKPCNIYLDPHVDMPHNEMRILTGFAVVSKRRCEIKDEHQIEREEGL